MRANLNRLPAEFRNGRDPHKAAASHILRKPVEEVTREERQRVKEAFYYVFTVRGPEILTNLIQGDDDDD